ncbi:MAG: phosphonopyruvate decarboxylase [Spirochaetaceae bacterium]|jgi:phosphonopyruvate decarboxylase|nr:phosphonopyruvate decarboxylase [Spirochaetaceae bacterium]
MLDTRRFGEQLKKRGFDFYSGVPCSFLKDLINYAINEGSYVMAANEGDAVAICAGAYLGKRKAVVLTQNSGLGNAVSPLTSLNAVFHIPVLGFVSLRGEPGTVDEPQHELMGSITGAMLQTMRIDHAVLSPEPGEAEAQVAKAAESIDAGKSYFFMVKRGTFSPVPLNRDKMPEPRRGLVSRLEMLRALKTGAPEDAVFLATTGFTGRELYELGDEPNNLYMAGSLGCVSSLGLGVSLARPDKKVLVLDGDGSLLMRAGSLGVNAWYLAGPTSQTWSEGKTAAMLHILFDNQAHESTGGQFTVSPGINYPLLAKAFGYPEISKVTSPGALKRTVEGWGKAGGLRFVYVPVILGASENLGRPKIKPYEAAERLKRFLG